MDLPLRFFLDGEHYVLVERRHVGPPEEGFEELGAWEAERLLAGALVHDEAQGLLRGGLGGSSTERGWDDRDGFVQRVRTRMADDPDRLMLLRRRRPLFSLVFTEPEVEDLADLVPADDAPEDTWIEVRVVDEDDEPCAGVEYEIELSDGRVRRGRTSEHGILRYDGMPPGSCKVKLVGVDGSAWELA